MYSRRKTVLGIVFIAVAALAGWWFWGSSQNPAGADSVVFRDDHNIEKELAEAAKRLPDATPSLVVSNDLSGKRQVAITIDGLADNDMMRRILEVLEKHHVKATFFAEGANAIASPDIIAAITGAGHGLGSYTYVGVAHAEQLPQGRLLEELVRAQQALAATAGKPPQLFKYPQAVYTEALLKTAGACGLSGAVRTTVFVSKDVLGAPNQAAAFVAKLKPGSILSLQLGEAVAVKPKTTVKNDEKPAIDKKPTIKDDVPSLAVASADPSELLERLIIALQAQKYEIGLVDNFRKFKYVPSSVPVNKVALFDGWDKGIALWQRGVNELFSPKKAYAAARPESAVSAVDFAQLRAQNDGLMAEEIKMVLTTEQAVPYTFVGLAKEKAVRAVLARLNTLGVKATFFIMEPEIKQQPQLIREIIADGHEIGIAVRPLAGMNFEKVCTQIIQTRQALRQQFGVETDLVKQPWGSIEPETKEAVAALGMRLIGQTINVVQAKHKDFQTAEEVMGQIFGKAVFSVGRGWIIHFRMDYYTQETLTADLVELLKRRKIDNIAYHAYGDDPDVNPKNDSAYIIRPVGAVLANEKFRYRYPAPESAVPHHLRTERRRAAELQETFIQSFKKRYIGFQWVNEEDRTLGFSNNELRHMDLNGAVITNKPVVFFTFDDWGSDASINHLLYVLRKHKVHGIFFILTNNVLNNPNLLRAIAAEGHDIGSHSNLHKPLVVRDANTNKQKPTQSREEYAVDVATSYERLVAIVGEVEVDGRPSLTRFFRPPTLAISRMGMEELFAAGYDYIVAGTSSTEDYSAESLHLMVERIKSGLYEKKAVKKGAMFVMHMSDNAKFTARALDAILTANEEKPDGDPTKFVVGKLSDYLVDDYDQSNRKRTLELEQSRLGEAGD